MNIAEQIYSQGQSSGQKSMSVGLEPEFKEFTNQIATHQKLASLIMCMFALTSLGMHGLKKSGEVEGDYFAYLATEIKGGRFEPLLSILWWSYQAGRQSIVNEAIEKIPETGPSSDLK